MNKNQIKDFIFSNYSNLVVYARQKFSGVEYKGNSVEDLIHEAIIAAIDCNKNFSDEADLLNFIHGCVNRVFGHEQELMKSGNFLVKFEGERKQDNIQGWDEFRSAYDLLYSHRFSDNNKVKCPFCGSKEEGYIINGGRYDVRYKCKLCRCQYTLTSSTYLHQNRIPLPKIIRALVYMRDHEYVPSTFLGRYIGVQQYTAYKLKYLVDSVHLTIGSRDLSHTLEKLLTNKETDAQGMIWKEKFKRKLSEEDKQNVIRLYKDGIHTATELSLIYNYDVSGLNKIIKQQVSRSQDRKQFILEKKAEGRLLVSFVKQSSVR